MSLKPRPSSVTWPLLARQWHVYLSMLIAPSILMFAFTGALQIFRLHEGHPGYRPLPIVEKLGRVHKDQVFALRPPRPAPAPKPGAGPRAPEAAPSTPLSKRVLQWFFVLVSAGLFVSTGLGIWMGVTVSRWKIEARWLVLVGAVLPVLILLLP